MPLSAPSARKKLHTRNIELNGYLREDGLFDIEAHMTDIKTYSIDNKAQRQGVFYSFGVYKLCIKKAKAGIENQR